MTRTLTLRRESLAELTPDELRGVPAANGAEVTLFSCVQGDLNRCISKFISCFYC